MLTLNSTAGPGEILESFFRFSVVGGETDFSIRLGNALAAGDGAVTGILDGCSGGQFLGIEPIECETGNSGTAIAFLTAFDSLPVSSVSLPASSFFDVFVDLTIDGGLAGFASLDTATITMTPEPSAMLTMATSLAAAFLTWMRRRRS
jgi:hypothetical protein